MLNALLGKVTSVFKQEFLLGAMLPVVLFWFAVLSSLGWVIGLGAVSSMYEELTRSAAAQISALMAIGLVVSAYVVGAVQPLILRIWSGESDFVALVGLQEIGLRRHRRRYDQIKRSSETSPEWGEVRTEFRQLVDGFVRSSNQEDKRSARWFRRAWLLVLARAIRPELGTERVRRYLTGLAEQYGTFTEASLARVFEVVNRKLTQWESVSSAAHQSAATLLDRSYGSRESVKATTLGNVVAAYNEYCFKRYKMEGEIFWPRLRRVIDPDYFEIVENQRILLDFCLTSATLAVTYAALALFVGPWLYYERYVWLVIGVMAILVAWFFVRLSVTTANRLGELIRSCFDLFRLELVRALGYPRPKDLAEEQRTWELLSQIIAYGVPSRDDVPYATAPIGPSSTPTPGPSAQVMARPRPNAELRERVSIRRGLFER
jgi:hypothetical protein